MSRPMLKLAKLAMMALICLSSSSAFAGNVYNDVYFRYDINMQNANVQLTGAQAFASLGNLPDTCQSLYQAIDAWNHALNWLDKVEAAPVAADDENRLSVAAITANRAEIKDKIAKTQTIIDGNCQAYPKK